VDGGSADAHQQATIRAAIYARYSSDKQNDKSVDDQIAFCREVAAREGFAVTMTFEDREISGAFSVNRPGFLAMMRAAETKLFDVIIAECADRLFRAPADYHAARRQLDFAGIAIHVAGGKVGKLDGALRAYEIFLDDLAVHTRRGLESVIRDGRHAGGRAYGYALVPVGESLVPFEFPPHFEHKKLPHHVDLGNFRAVARDNLD